MKIIPTSAGPILLDDCDFLFALGLSPSWQVTAGYAKATICGEPAWLHKLIAERHGLFGEIDHRNQNRLDDQSANLRVSTHSQNGANHKICKRNSSGFKGVSWCNTKLKWKAQICVNWKRLSLGYWETAEAAARVYDQAALKFFGEFASLNFPRSDYAISGT